MENSTKFYPNAEYNRKRRNKYFSMLALLTLFILLMDVWFVQAKIYYLLIVNVALPIFFFLIPRAMKENPIKHEPVLEVTKTEVCVMGKTIAISEIRWVKAIVYLGKVGNPLENREFLEAAAAGEPLLEMLGSIEVCYTGNDGKAVSEFAVCENVVEALMLIMANGKVEYRLGYSLGKEYRKSTYNLNDFIAKTKEEKKPEIKTKSKYKQII